MKTESTFGNFIQGRVHYLVTISTYGEFRLIYKVMNYLKSVVSNGKFSILFSKFLLISIQLEIIASPYAYKLCFHFILFFFSSSLSWAILVIPVKQRESLQVRKYEPQISLLYIADRLIVLRLLLFFFLLFFQPFSWLIHLY